MIIADAASASARTSGPRARRGTRVPASRSRSGRAPARGWTVIVIVTSEGAIERFGDLSTGEMFFTVRGMEGKSLQGKVTADLGKWNIENPRDSLKAWDVLKDSNISLIPGESSFQVSFPVSLESGEVGVYGLSLKKPNGFQIR